MRLAETGHHQVHSISCSWPCSWHLFVLPHAKLFLNGEEAIRQCSDMLKRSGLARDIVDTACSSLALSARSSTDWSLPSIAASVSHRHEPVDFNISTNFFRARFSLTVLDCRLMQLMHAAGRCRQQEKIQHAFALPHKAIPKGMACSTSELEPSSEKESHAALARFVLGAAPFVLEAVIASALQQHVSCMRARAAPTFCFAGQLPPWHV